MSEQERTNSSQPNYWHVVGTLEDDPKLGETGNGYEFVYFVVKNRRVWRGKDGQGHEAIENIQIWVWKPALIPLAKELAKGEEVSIKGNLRVLSQNGNDKIRLAPYMIEILKPKAVPQDN